MYPFYPMSKNFQIIAPLLICVVVLFSLPAKGQKLEQDCPYALPICFDTYVQPNSYNGQGRNPNEIGPNSCLQSGEVNDVWYTFTAESAGNLGFLITPNSVAIDDYDWAVYDLTNNPCSDIAIDRNLEISCNYAISAGPTGATAAGTGNSQGAGGTLINSLIPVVQGGIYVINVSNFSSSQSGYTIDFATYSDVSIFDVTDPSIREELRAEVSCGTDSLHIRFSENILCNSFDLSDLTISSTSGIYSIDQIYSDICTLDVSYGKDYTLILDNEILAGDSIFIELTGEVEDVCKNLGTGGILKLGTPEAQKATIEVNDACPGELVTINVNTTGGASPFRYTYTSPSNFNLSNSGNTFFTYTSGVAGEYPFFVKITGRNGKGCSIFENGSFTVFEGGDATYTSNKVGTYAFEFNRNALSGNSTWEFGFGAPSNDENPFINFPDDGVYNVTHIIESENGCLDTSTSVVDIANVATPADAIYLHIPNSFSPNGDNINDEWKFLASGIASFNLQVYNRWGEEVFRTNSVTEQWRPNADAAKIIGAYPYTGSVTFTDGRTESIKGVVSITN